MKIRIFLASLIFLLPMEKLTAQKQKPDIHFEIFPAGYAVAPKSWVGRKDDTAYCIAIILKNNSKRDFKFGHYTCGWKGMFQPLNEDFKYVGYGCDANYPTTTTLKPGQVCMNYAFFRKVKPSAKFLQLSFTYYEAESYMKYWRNPNTFRETADRNSHPKPAFLYDSNVCQIAAQRKIDFFGHTRFLRPEEMPYYCIGVKEEKQYWKWDGFTMNFH